MFVHVRSKREKGTFGIMIAAFRVSCASETGIDLHMTDQPGARKYGLRLLFRIHH